MSKRSIYQEFRSSKYFALPASPFIIPLVNGTLAIVRKTISLPKGLIEKKIALSTPDDERIKLRILTPEGVKKNAPCLIYFHGSAFFMTQAPHHKKLVAEYALRTGAVVVSVAYRLAPKDPFPTPLNDCDLATNWVFNHADYLGISTDHIAIGGDSAGGALAAGVSLLRRDRKDKPFCFQLLIYPVTDARMESPSMKEFDDTPFWSSRLNEMMWSLYVREDRLADQKYAAPLEAESFADLPDTYMEVCEYDPLRDEGLIYAQKIEAAGSKVERHIIKGVTHGYDMALKSELALSSIDKRVHALINAFSK